MVNQEAQAEGMSWQISKSLGNLNQRIEKNAVDLSRELSWFRTILHTRSRLNAAQETEYSDIWQVLPPDLADSDSDYAELVTGFDLDFADRFLLMLGLVPHIKPELLDIFIVHNEKTKQLYTEFGGRLGKDSSGFLPTGETAMFVLAGDNLAYRFALQEKFAGDHYLIRNRIVWLDDVGDGEPILNGALVIANELLDQLTTGHVQKPRFGGSFPAKQLETAMEWTDLVLALDTFQRLDEIDTWLQHHKVMMADWGMDKMLKPGYKALFYGPPGTGKSLTAALLGKRTGQAVYRIDLSRIVSKYIGETEKNLSRVFDRAEGRNWILFFDEAEALFSKRSSISDSHDRYANQEVAYLLQRIEDYDGLVILASNLKSNLDEAFYRRFQSVIHFPMPGPEERLVLWQQSFSAKAELEDKINLRQIAKEYSLSGGPILNVVQYASLQALKRGTNTIRQQDIIEGIRREYHKNEKTI